MNPDNETADQLASEGRTHPTEGPLEYRLSPEELAAIYKRDWDKVLITGPLLFVYFPALCVPGS